MSQLLDYLLARQADMHRTLAGWVNHDSPTFAKAATDAMGQMLVRAFEQAGATLTTVHPQPELGDHYTLTWGSGDSQILLLCHFDTVWPLGEAQKRPFTITEGRATGPGVHDMKGGTLIALFALKALRQLGLQPRHKVVILLTSDEEIGSPTSGSIIEAEGRRSNVCLVLEGAHNRQRLTTSRKGVGRFVVDISGKAAHSGVEPQNGASAIEELARQIQALHALTDFERGITVNVGVISGGERPNIVAPHAKADVDLRVSTAADGEAVSRKIMSLPPQVSGCDITVTGGITRPPFEETAAGLALFERAQAIAHQLGFSVEKYSSGGGSDGNLVAALGVPTLDGLGTLGGGAHALTEHIVLESLPQRAALLAELLLSLD
jgi:glutamate carboxypeptidase